ncbi:MAG: protein kinase [Chloroflexi bacterium]|nr:protein kinase [Chloroflexota bacterium]
MPLDVGEIVEDRYRVVKLLGQGGMGAVYRAWDTRLNRPVALKEMVPQVGIDGNMLTQLREQFEQEAQILGTLTHPSLVRVTDYFGWNENVYLVMDFVEGEDLANMIYREGAQSEEKVLAWAKQLLDALAYCHKKGVLHRDIKPQNIVITPEDKAILVDFGLVKLWNPQDPETRTVMRGAGTPEYAPPEQYDMGVGHTDPRSDIYSMGATLYQALTGQAPPTATQRMASPASFVTPRRMNVTVSSSIERIVLKALEIAMENRYQSADDMLQAFQGDSQTSVITPSRPTWESQPTAPIAQAEAISQAKPKRGILLGLGGAGLVIVGLLCLALAAGAVLVGWYFWDGGGTTSITPVPPTAARVEATPTLAPEIGNVIFQDDFDNPASGWEIGDYDTGDVGYKDSIYFVTSTENGKVMWGVTNRSFDNSFIEVDATQIIAGPESDNAYGVVCRDQGNGDGYYLRVSGDGFYSIAIAQEGEFEALVEWAESSAIQQGNATNHIQAVCNGSTLTMSVNGELLATIEDHTFASGDIALTATTYEDKGTEVHFDNLVVRGP